MEFLLKLFLCLILSICFGQNVLAEDLYDSFLDNEEIDFNSNQTKFVDKTKDALLAVDFIEKRANYLAFKIKNLTFGNYSDHLIYVAPFITGKVEVKMYDFDLYYDHLSTKSGVNYKYTF